MIRFDGRKVVIFGAGSTGRGHIGQLAYESGKRIVYVDKDLELVSILQTAGKYTVNLVGQRPRSVEIRGFRILSVNDVPKVIDEVSTAGLIFTAIFAENLHEIGSVLAESISIRQSLRINHPMNIIACENMVNSSQFLKEYVYEHLDEDTVMWAEQYVGFPNTMVARVVPVADNKLILNAEDYNEWTVDASQIKGGDPKISGMSLVDNQDARLERKLFMHNTGHAMCGYLAYLKGYKTMNEAIKDKWIESKVRGAMIESGNALISKHGFERAEIDYYREGLFPRLRSSLLIDTVERVTRAPVRKIGRNERLAGPACMALDYDITPVNLALGIAALIMYRCFDDLESQRILCAYRQGGVKRVLSEIAGINLDCYPQLLTLVQQGMEELETICDMKEIRH